MQVVLPGEALHSFPKEATVKLGPGVVQTPTSLTSGSSSSRTPQLEQQNSTVDLGSTRSGILGHQSSRGGTASSTASNAPAVVETCWVEAHSKRYTPALGEPVIGVIIARHAEGYRVDIGASQSASLDALAFEDATKRNKPNLKVGTVIYARVSLALPFCEPELECLDPKTGKSQGFGELSGGMLVRDLELSKCRALLSSAHPLLSSLGAKYPFELAIGVNGRVWVKATETRNTIDLINSIKAA